MARICFEQKERKGTKEEFFFVALPG